MARSVAGEPLQLRIRDPDDADGPAGHGQRQGDRGGQPERADDSTSSSGSSLRAGTPGGRRHVLHPDGAALADRPGGRERRGQRQTGPQPLPRLAAAAMLSTPGPVRRVELVDRRRGSRRRSAAGCSGRRDGHLHRGDRRGQLRGRPLQQSPAAAPPPAPRRAARRCPARVRRGRRSPRRGAVVVVEGRCVQPGGPAEHGQHRPAHEERHRQRGWTPERSVASSAGPPVRPDVRTGRGAATSWPRAESGPHGRPARPPAPGRGRRSRPTRSRPSSPTRRTVHMSASRPSTSGGPGRRAAADGGARGPVPRRRRPAASAARSRGTAR